MYAEAEAKGLDSRDFHPRHGSDQLLIAASTNVALPSADTEARQAVDCDAYAELHNSQSVYRSFSTWMTSMNIMVLASCGQEVTKLGTRAIMFLMVEVGLNILPSISVRRQRFLFSLSSQREVSASET